MNCPKCGTTQIKKNGNTPKGVQNYVCKFCKRAFVETSNRVSMDDAAAIMKLHAEGYSGRHIGRLLGRGETTVRKVIQRDSHVSGAAPAAGNSKSAVPT